MPADLVSAPSTAPWPSAYLIRCGPLTVNCLPGVEQAASPGGNAPGISPQLMMKASSPRLGTSEHVLYCLSDPRIHPVAHKE